MKTRLEKKRNKTHDDTKHSHLQREEYLRLSIVATLRELLIGIKKQTGDCASPQSG